MTSAYTMLHIFSSCTLLSILCACGDSTPEPQQELQQTFESVPATKPAEGWFVTTTVDPMTDAVVKTASVAGAENSGEPAKLTFMCGTGAVAMELVVIQTTSYLGYSGHRVGYRVDGGEAAYTSSPNSDSPNSIGVANKSEFIDAIRAGSEKIVIQISGDYGVLLTFPLKSAASAIDEARTGCHRY